MTTASEREVTQGNHDVHNILEILRHNEWYAAMDNEKVETAT